MSTRDFALSAHTVAEDAADDVVIGLFLDVLGPESGDIETLSLMDDAGGLFKIVGAELQLADGSLLDFETAQSHDITVRVTDGDGLFVDKTFTITVTDVNEAPTDVAVSASTVGENAALGTVVGTLQGVIDPDAGDTHTFNLVDDAGGRFKLVNAELEVADGTLFDFETAASHAVTVRVTDAAGLSFDKAFTITVADVNEAPTGFALSASTVVEGVTNNTAIGVLHSVADPDAGDIHTFSLVDDAGGRFKLVGAQLQVANGALLDFGTAASHTVMARVTDAGGLAFDEAFTVTVTPAPEPITVLDAHFDADVDGFTYSDGVFGGALDQPRANGSWNGTLSVKLGGTIDNTGGWQSVFTLATPGSANQSFRYNLTQTANYDPDEFSEVLFAVDGGAATSVVRITGDGDGGVEQTTGWQLFEVDLGFLAAGDHTVTIGGLNSQTVLDDEITRILVDDVVITTLATGSAPTDFALSANTVAEGVTSDTVVGALQGVVDPDAGDAHTFSLLDDAGERFKLVGAELQVANGPLDHETLANHAVTVRVTDSAGLSFDKAFTIDVGDLNEAPTVGDQALAVDENRLAGTVVGTVAGSDPDAAAEPFGTLSHAITAGNAAGLFAIDAASGEITTTQALDHEAAAQHVLTVEVTDGATPGLTDTATITIDVGDLNDAPTVGDQVLAVNENQLAGTVVGAVAASDQGAADTVSYAITAGNAAGLFAIDAASGEITTTQVLDHEAAAQHVLTVEVTDGATPGLTNTATITADVGDLNEAPTVGHQALAVDENRLAGTVIGTVAASDPDAAAEPFGMLSYAITAGNAAGLFAIDAASGEITTTRALDHEAAAQHVLTVEVTDSATPGLADTATITIDVDDLNEAPTDVAVSASTVGENAALGTVVGTLQGVIDPDAGDTHTFNLVDDAGGRFKLVNAELEVADGTLFDFETAASHAVTVRVTDAAGLSFDKAFTITVADVNEAPTGFALSASTVVEGVTNNTAIGVLHSVADPDAGDIHTFSLVDDAGGRFKLVGAQLQVANGALLDFGTAASHTVMARVTDAGGLAFDEAFTVTVTPAPEPITVLEAHFDADAEGFTYADGVFGGDQAQAYASGSWVDGALRVDLGGLNGRAVLDMSGGWQGAFTLDTAANIALSFRHDLTLDADYEPDEFSEVLFAVDGGVATSVVRLTGDGDGGSDQTTDWQLFEIDLGPLTVGDHTVTIGGLNNKKTTLSEATEILIDDIVITASPTGEAPTDFALSANTVAEGAATDAVVGTLQGVVDPDVGDAHVFSLVDDAGGRFKIAGSELQVADGALLDFETVAVHAVAVRVTDSAGLFVDKTFTINVTDANDAPTGFTLSASTVAEGVAADTVVGTLQDVVDPDAGDTHTFSLVDDAGGRFKLVGTELRVADGALLDFEAAAVHAITVRVTDGAGLSIDKTLTINVTDANEAPTGFTLSASTVAEGAATDTVVGTLQGVVDPDAGDAHVFSLVDDAGGRFKIVGAELQVVDGSLLATAQSHTITAQAVDAGGLFVDKAFTITVTDANTAPTGVALSANVVAEGAATAAVVGTLQSVVDPDAGDTHTFSLVDDAGGRFQLVGATLQVANAALLDFEDAASHTITARVTDAIGLSVDKTFTIGLTDVNEAPVDFTLSASAVSEGAALGSVVGTLQGVVDPDAGDTHTFSLVDDAGGRFQLVGATLQVANAALLDFEDAASHTITARVTDAIGLSVDKTFTIGLTDVNEAPVDFTLSASAVSEGAALGSVVGTLQGVVDPDAGDTHTFSLVDDAGGRFQLVGATLQVANAALLDFEDAASHTITARVTDAIGLSVDKTFTIGLTDVNEAPVDFVLSASAVSEGAALGSVVGTLQGVVDPDAGDTHTFSLVDDAGGRFQLVGATLQVANAALLDFETAANHTITARVTDAIGLSVDKTFTIGLTDVNEAPVDFTLSASAVSEGAALGSVVGTLQGVVDPDAGDTHTFSLVDDAGGRFQLVGATLQVANAALLDFEDATSHAVTVRVTDAGGLTYDKTFTIDITDVNEAPIVGDQAFAVDENQLAGAVVGTVVASDPDAADTLSYAITAGNAAGLFAIDAASGEITTTRALDHEAAAQHVLTVEVTDSATPGLADTATITIDVDDLNEAPTDVAVSASTVGENAALGTVVGTLQGVIDPDAGDTHTFNLVDDAGGRFKLVNAELEVADGTLFDFETAASHAVTVRVTDAAGLSFDKAFTITVADVNEAPTGFALSASTVVEGVTNNTAIGVLHSVADPDAGDIHTFSLVDDAGGRFKLVGAQLQVANGALLDFGTAASHTVMARVTDAGGLAFDEAFTVTVTPAPEPITVLEAHFDADAEGFTYADGVFGGDQAQAYASGSWVDGALRVDLGGLNGRAVLDMSGGWQGAFTLDTAANIALSFRHDLTLDADYEPDEFSEVLFAVDGGVATSVVRLTGDGDGGSDQTTDWQLFEIDLGPLTVGDHTVTIGGLNNKKTTLSEATEILIDDIVITASPTGEAPTDFALSANTVAEGAATDAVVGTLQGVVDPDVGDAHVFSLVDDAGGRFKIAGSELQVADGALLDFETVAVHAVAVRVTDSAGLFVDKTFTINVTDANDAPTGFTLSASTVAEGVAADTVVGTLQDVVDPDAGDTHTFSLVDDAGGRFKLVGTELRVADGALLDFEAAAVHAITVRVTDGAGLSVDKTLTINVTDANEAPTGFTLSASTVAEGAATDTVVGTLQGVVDPDVGDAHVFSLVDDAGGRFKIAGSELQVADGALLDFETVAVHAVAVRVTDSAGLSVDKTFTINVTDANDAPTGFTLSASTVAEGVAADTVVGTLQDVVDPDAGDTHTFSLVDDAGGRFKLVGTEPRVADGALLDFEAAAVHAITVRVTDGAGLSIDKTLTINVTDANEAPTGFTLSASTVAEGAATDTVVGTLQGVVDPDAGDAHVFSLVDDAGGRFKIVGAELQVVDGSLLATAQSHTITAQAVDAGGLFVDKAFTITVTDANTAPTGFALSANVVAEGAATAAVVGTFQDVVDPDAGDTHSISLLDDAGGRFQLVGAELQVANGALLDFEAAPSQNVTARVTDTAGLSFDKTFTIALTDVNEAPVDFTLSASAVSEGAALGSVVGTLQGVVDPDAGDTHTFSLVDDAGGRFKIVSAELQVVDGSLLATAQSHTITAQAVDAGGLFVDKAFTITVTDANTAPTGFALSANVVAEGAATAAVVGTFQDVVDPDAGDTHSISLLDDAGGQFQLVGAELQVANGALLDFESASSHTITVRVTDGGGLSFDKTFAVAVINVAEAPTDFTLSGAALGITPATDMLVGAFENIVEPDAGNTYTFTLLDSAGGRFKVVGNELLVANGSLLGANTSHDITARVTDSSGSLVDKSFTVSVCPCDSTGRVPLTDLGEATYQGFTGGLYPDSSNTRPAGHEADGLVISNDLVVPRDAAGAVDLVNGQIGFTSIGMSNTRFEFNQFVWQVNHDPDINPQLVVFNGAQAGQTAKEWADPNDEVWTVLADTVASNGLSAEQVQVVWVKLTSRASDVSSVFAEGAAETQAWIQSALQILKDTYPNVGVAYLSSRIYGGYAGLNVLSPEPNAYENGFTVKWLIESQIDGDPGLAFDGDTAEVPWLSWGPYLWADGVGADGIEGGVPGRSDGLEWTTTDLAADGIHPSQDGKAKIGTMLVDWMKNDATAQPWFLDTNNVAPTAAPDGPYTVDVGGLLTIDALNGTLANDTDADNDPLTALPETQPTHGDLTLNPDGSFTYQHGSGATTADTFTYLAHDGKGGIQSATVTIAIGADNQAVAGSDADQFDFTSGDTTTETGTTDAVDLAHVDAVNADNAPDQISSSDPDQPISLGDDEAATLVGVGEADEMDHLL